MAKVIAIKDRDTDGGLAVDLGHVFKLFDREGPALFWSILDLYTMGYKEENKEMLEMEESFERAKEKEGVPVSWTALLILAKSCRQIIDAVIVGCKDPDYRPKLSSAQPIEGLYNECELVLELIDSSLWNIYARNDEIIQRFEREFRYVKVITLEGKG